MAATLTGTPTAITWAAGADPAGQSITIPSDATAVYMFWSYYHGTAGNGLSTVTLNSVSPNETFEFPTATGSINATGVAAWYNPATGSQTLDPAWDASPVEGPTTIVAYVKGGNTTAWRDADANATASTTANSVTLTTNSTDLVLKMDQKFGSSPSTSSGWTSQQTMNNNSEYANLETCDSPGASTTACDSEGENYSSIVAVSIPAAAGGGGTGYGQFFNKFGFNRSYRPRPYAPGRGR